MLKKSWPLPVGPTFIFIAACLWAIDGMIRRSLFIEWCAGDTVVYDGVGQSQLHFF
jgi:hypothetical protein